MSMIESLEPRKLFHTVFPTAAEQYMVELINRARANPTKEAERYDIDLNEGLASGTISTARKQPLAINNKITHAARGHSVWMLGADVFSHTGSGGSSPSSRVQADGYVLNAPGGIGENIAWSGTTGDDLPLRKTTAQLHENLFVDEGIAGRGHRLNILNASFREIGAGVVRGQFNQYNAVMATNDFAYSGSRVFLTGVAYDDRLENSNNFYTAGEGLKGVTITAKRQSDGKVFTTKTWKSGGYSLKLPNGTYNVTGSGETLGGPIKFNDVTINGKNVKRDFRKDKLAAPSSFSPAQFSNDPIADRHDDDEVVAVSVESLLK